MHRLRIICDQMLIEWFCYCAGAVVIAVYGGHVICHRGA